VEDERGDVSARFSERALFIRERASASKSPRGDISQPDANSAVPSADCCMNHQPSWTKVGSVSSLGTHYASSNALQHHAI